MFSLKDTLHVTPVVGPIFGYAWLTPLAFIAAGLILGLIFERIVLVRLHKMAERTEWKGDDIIIAGIRGLTTLWFLLLGLYGALLNITLPVHIHVMGQKLLMVIFIVSATLAAAKIIAGLVALAGAGADSQDVKTASILRNVARIVVFSIGLLIVLQSLGISITPILTALGVGGLAVALALQPTLGNLFAGIQILASKQIRPGDYVKIDGGHEGTIEDITWRTTLIRSPANNSVIVPNSNLATAIVTNLHTPTREIGVTVPVVVAMNSDLEKVERVAREVARGVLKNTSGAVSNYEPLVRFNQFGDFGIKFNVILRAQTVGDQFVLQHEFIKRLQKRFAEEEIQLAVLTWPTKT